MRRPQDRTARFRLRREVRAAVACLTLALTGCGEAPPAPAPSDPVPQASSPPIAGAPARPGFPPAETGGAEGSEAPPAFLEVAAERGITFTREDDLGPLHRIHEGPGGGVGLLDYDRDGALDVLFTNGCVLPLPVRNDAPPSPLYRSVGQRFQPAEERAGLALRGYLTGVAVGDVNSDGFPDLFVAGFRSRSLWLNNGDGTFQDASERLPDWGPRWNTSAVLADLNQDGHPDLYVVTYLTADDRMPRICRNDRAPDGRYQCPPTIFPPEPDVLLLNDGSGGFVDVSREAGVALPDGRGLGVVATDFNQDGRLDLFVANDGTPNFLFVNAGIAAGESPERAGAGTPPVPRFEERALETGCAVGEDGTARAGMGIALGDVDRDGWDDLFVTNFFAEPNTLYSNVRGEHFADRTAEARLVAPSRMMLGWGAVLFDQDHDGWLDLFIANGHINDLSWSNNLEKFRMPPQFFRNDGQGGFREESRGSGPYFHGDRLGRGVAMGDLDGDLRQDLVVSQQLAPSSLLLNQSRGNHLLRLRLIGRSGCRDAVGSRAALSGVPALSSEVPGGGGFQASHDLDLDFGLGERNSPSNVEVRWGNRDMQRFTDVAADTLSVLVEGITEPFPLPPRQPGGFP